MSLRHGCALFALGCSLLLPHSAGAEALDLDTLLRGMASASGVEARFVEEQELALLSSPLESRGTLYFVPPDRLARFTEIPAKTALVIDGKRVRFRDAKQEVDLSASPIARHFVSNLIVLWAGDAAALRERYETQLRELPASEARSGAAPAWELVLTPRRAPLSRFLANITLRGDARGMQQMAVLDGEGNRTTTRFVSVDGQRRFEPAELARLFEAGEALPGAPRP